MQEIATIKERMAKAVKMTSERVQRLFLVVFGTGEEEMKDGGRELVVLEKG